MIPISQKIISITHDRPALISDGSISIYQNNSGTHLLRQVIPGNRYYQNITYSPGKKTLYFDILSSTFNQGNANYFIVVEDNAMKSESGQPLLGVEAGEKSWNFGTGM